MTGLPSGWQFEGTPIFIEDQNYWCQWTRRERDGAVAYGNGKDKNEAVRFAIANSHVAEQTRPDVEGSLLFIKTRLRYLDNSNSEVKKIIEEMLKVVEVLAKDKKC